MPLPSATAILHTTKGDILVDLYGDQAPRTVQNFTGLADGSGSWTDPRTGAAGDGPLYRDVVFHRIIPNFMIQGGDPLGQGTGGPGYAFDDEISPELTFAEPYKLAMANAGLRRDPSTGKVGGTNGSQFFITTDPTPWLQGKHTIFGEVTDADSQAVVDAIAAVATGPGDRPLEPVVVTSIDVSAV